MLGYFTIPRTEPVRPIDPGAWVAHTQALTSHDTVCQDIQEPIRERLDPDNLDEIVKAMTKPDSGLEIRDRMWLKITIPNAFIGADAVNWVLENVEGVNDRREARRIVSSMLRNNLIKHTVNKLTFSEQCYYVLSDGKKQCKYLKSGVLREKTLHIKFILLNIINVHLLILFPKIKTKQLADRQLVSVKQIALPVT